MKAAILTETRKIEHYDVEVPCIGENEVLIKVVNTGICGSDLLTYKGAHPYKKPPIILGHELCGIVADVGSSVKDIAKGDKVCVESYSACENCPYCEEGKPNLCSNKKNSGCDEWQGCFAEYFKAPKNCVYRLPENISFSEGALIEPLAISLHALKLSNMVEGKNIAVIGSGNIGLSSLICAKKLGAKNILCVDLSEFKSSLAKKLGADYVVNVSKDNLISSANGIFNEGADITIVATGYPNVINEAVEITKKGGEIIVVSYFEKDLNADWNKMVRKELKIKNSALSCKEDFLTVIKWLENKELQPLSLISHRFPLEKAKDAMDLMGGEAGKIILYNEFEEE